MSRIVLGTMGGDLEVRLPANAERVTVGVVGCSRGRLVGRVLAAQGAAVKYVCDPDEARAAQARDELGADHAVADLR